MRKKVLIITYYWPPAGGGGVQRWVKFVKYLGEFGWEPIVFTVKNGNYPIIDNTLEGEIPDNIEVLTQAIVEPYSLYNRFTGKSKNAKIDANFLSQGKKMGFKDKLAVWIRGNFFIPDARSWWIGPSAKTLLRYLKTHPVDAMVSSGPPHSCHLIASRIKSEVDIPWLVDYRDPWTQIDYFDDLQLSNFAKKRHQMLEKRVLNQCNIIVTVGKTMADDLMSITSNLTKVITNGFDESDRLGSSVTLDRDFTITYIGTMNASRNPIVLWSALHELRSENHPMMQNIRINLVGNPESIVAETIQKMELTPYVDFKGYVTHASAIEYQNTAQLLLLVINDTTNNKSILTGKIFEYLASNRPIICIGPKDGDAAQIISESNAGIMIDYTEVDLLVSYLKEAFEKYKRHDLVNSTSGIEKYSRRNLTKQLAEVLDNISHH